MNKEQSLEGPPPCEQGSKGQTGKWAQRCTSPDQDDSSELDLEWISSGIRKILSWQMEKWMTNRKGEGQKPAVDIYAWM